MRPMTDKEICLRRIADRTDAFTVRRFNDSEDIFFRMYTAGCAEVWQPQEYIHTKISIPLLILLAAQNGELLIEHEDVATSLTITITPQIKISGMSFDV